MISHDIINALIRTEKSVRFEKEDKYFFHVAPNANKIQIGQAVEEIYKVKVASVRVMNVPGKLRRVRVAFGRTSPWKKAIVTLQPGHKIEVS